MKKVSKPVRKVLLGTFAAVASAGVASAYARAMRAREIDLLEHPIGQLVGVDGRRMCIFAQGDGEHTLVFLSGSGTVSPILDFKSL